MKNLLFVIGLVLPLTLAAQEGKDKRNDALSLPKTPGITDRAGGTHDKGNIRHFFENRGKLYPRRPEDGPDGEFPANSGREYIYRLAPYVGIPKNVVQGRFTTNEEWEAVGGYHNPVQTGKLSVAFSDRPQTWPASGWPVKDSLGNPIIISDQDSYCVYSDSTNQKRIGIVVKQTGYVFGVKMARNIIFFKFEIVNISGRRLDSIYFALYNDFDVGNISGGAPEWGDDKHGFDKDLGLTWAYDADNSSSEWPGAPPGMMGVIMIKTPKVNGIEPGATDWHYHLYDDDMDIDSLIYGIMSTDPKIYNSALYGQKYFHPGANAPNMHFDDPNTIPASGMDILSYLSSGPYSAESGESLTFVTALVAGDDLADLMTSAQVARNIVALDWVVARPPVLPALRAEPGDRRVRLYWDNRSELSRDKFTNQYDFEGYRLYRSLDKGVTWDQLDRNANSSLGSDPVPIAEFDRINEVGKNTGLQYSYRDTNLINGIEYWYSLTAYDKGDSSIASLESPRGSNLELSNIVSVVPVQPAIGRTPPSATTPVRTGTGNTDYDLLVSPVDVEAVASRNYTVEFLPAISLERGNPSTKTVVVLASADSANFKEFAILFTAPTTFNVVDAATNSVVLSNQSYTSGAPIAFRGLTVTLTDTLASPVEDFLPQAGDSILVSPGIRILSGSDVVLPLQKVRYNVPLASVNGLIIMITPTTYIRSGALTDGMGLTVSLLVANPDSVVDDTYYITVLSANTTTSTLSVEVRNSGNSVVARNDTIASGDALTFKGIRAALSYSSSSLPAAGTRYTLTTGVPKPISYKDGFTFTVNPATVNSQAIKNEISKVKVVPNPYVVSSRYEEEFGDRRREPIRQIKFIHLPPECTIYIFTLDGDLVRTLRHSGSTGVATWDMRTSGGREIATGVYLYLVKTSDAEKLDRFAVIK